MSQEMKPITIKKLGNKLPLILNNKIILKKELIPFKGNVKVVKSIPVHEDIIYDSKCGEFLPGDVRELTIVNRLNKQSNSCRTIARCKSASGVIYEKTSDEITKLIGQANYDILFSTLCSVINQELKIRGIYSLLTVPKFSKPVACQTEELKNNSNSSNPAGKHMQCQTDETYIASYKSKMRRRPKRAQLAPYVVPDKPEEKLPKKIVITPSNFDTILKATDKKDEVVTPQKEEPPLPELNELGSDFNDNSNSSIGPFSIPGLLANPMTWLDDIDKVIRNDKEPPKTPNQDYTLHNLDSPLVIDERKQVPLKSLPSEIRVKMLMKQSLNDLRTCLLQDQSGHLPIHVAVLNNDMDLLKRQCLVLKARNISVDIPADNLTPLKMSLYQENAQMTALLLQYNADPLDSDDHDKTCFHIAAEIVSDHLQALVLHCQHKARKILEENEELWKLDYAKKTDEELAKILLNHINKLYDDQGYTPLMLASKLGRYENVKLLLESSPETINSKMPSSGNTALYIAVGAACMDSTERGDKSKVVDHFRKTIEILVENGADPNMNNFAGSNVNDLLTEYNIGDLSMLIANKLTCRNFWDGKLPEGAKKFDSFMLVKDGKGNVGIKTIERPQKTQKSARKSKTTKKTAPSSKVACVPPLNTVTTKPIIVKTETLTGQNSKSPLINTNFGKIGSVTNMAKVQNFKLNKPLLLKTVASNNKRKLEITVDNTVSKKSNTND